jgi:hypothetical protein
MGDTISGMYYLNLWNQVTKLPSTTEFEVVGCSDKTSSSCGIFLTYTNVTYMYSGALVAGRYFDGSIAYVGSATVSDCHYSADEIVRLSTKDDAIVAYHACGNATSGREITHTGTSYYLKNYEGNVWKTTSMNAIGSLGGVYSFSTEYSTMAAGRLKINNYTVVGKVWF